MTVEIGGHKSITVGRCCMRGLGRRPDMWQSMTLYRKAMAMEEKQFKKFLADTKKMTKEQREEARALLLDIDPTCGVPAQKGPVSGHSVH